MTALQIPDPEIPNPARRDLLTLGSASLLAIALPWLPARAAPDTAAIAPIQRFNTGLLAAMKAGEQTPFADRYRALAPIVQQVFNLDAVLATSIGLSWASLSDDQKARLGDAFARYTVSSYLANFNSYNGQTFEVLPDVRTIAPDQAVVQTKLQPANGSAVELDYVMRRFPTGWQAVDVLTNGSISRVAVQRSDFTHLINRGGAPALVLALNNKTANLSGGRLS
ncbi:MAG TPA: ABC transporter substrate-binding protein [Rhodopila sp.]|nr:ABC transporter substrate-binding protein [Rhodopila sp.]